MSCIFTSEHWKAALLLCWQFGGGGNVAALYLKQNRKRHNVCLKDTEIRLGYVRLEGFSNYLQWLKIKLAIFNIHGKWQT